MTAEHAGRDGRGPLPSALPTRDDALALLHRLADAGGRAALSHFRAPSLTADNKDAAGFDPVTAGDREAEAAIRAILAEARPSDAVLGEEQAETAGTSGLTWVIDPIDGTRAFLSGLPTWGVLIALDTGAEGALGAIDQPHTGERFVGTAGPYGLAAELRRGGGAAPISVRDCPSLGHATLFTTDPLMFAPNEQPLFDAVRRRARLTRYGIDCYAYALLALGHVDLVIESGLKAYDIAAPAVVVRGAGGTVTDWHGGDPRWGGRVVAAGDPRVHAEALEILSRIA